METRSAGALFAAGAMQTWQYVHAREGGGQRGQDRARAAVSARFPGVSTQTLDVVARESAAALAAARRYNTAGASYQLPASAFGDLSSYERRAGIAGETLYGHRATYTYSVHRPGQSPEVRTRQLSISSPNILTLGELRQTARIEATRQIALESVKSPTAGASNTPAPEDLKFTAAFRFVG